MINKNISFGGAFVFASLIAGTGLVTALGSGPLSHPVGTSAEVPQMARAAGYQTARYQPAVGEPSTRARLARNEALAEPAFDDLTSQTCPRCR